MIRFCRKFLEHDIWIMPVGAPPLQRFFLRTLRIIFLTVRLFLQNQCPLKASALTYYTIFSLVPVAAFFFGIAQICGFADMLEKKVRSWFHLYPEAANLVISFSYDTLREAKGGIIAGAGVLLLIWTTVKLLANIEYSLNSIWGVRRGRSLVRKITDYISIIVVCPVLLMTAASGLVFASSAMGGVLDTLAVSAFIPTGFFAKLVPLAAIWGGLTFLYMVMPNTRVKFISALPGGLFAAIIYLSFQYLYIYLQFMLVKQNTIYGSFAALPLLLLFLHLSWLVFLAGAQLTFSLQNEKEYEMLPGKFSLRKKYICIFAIMETILPGFKAEGRTYSDEEISRMLSLPIRLTRELLNSLVKAGILCECSGNGKEELATYLPALPLEKLTPEAILAALEKEGEEEGTIFSSGNKALLHGEKILQELRSSGTCRNPWNI